MEHKKKIMKVDNEGKKYFELEEGRKNYVYKDSKGLDTFGIGHLLVLPKDEYLKKYTRTNQAPNSLVNSIFESDLKRFENRVDTELNKRDIKVNQNQFTALTSFAFNIGESGFKKSLLLKNLKDSLSKNDFDTIKKGFLGWANKNRRNREFELFSMLPTKK